MTASRIETTNVSELLHEAEREARYVCHGFGAALERSYETHGPDDCRTNEVIEKRALALQLLGERLGRGASASLGTDCTRADQIAMAVEDVIAGVDTAYRTLQGIPLDESPWWLQDLLVPGRLAESRLRVLFADLAAESGA